MRDKIYFALLVLIAGLLLYLGRGLLVSSAVIAWGLTFAGVTAASVFGMALYRVQLELRASQRELARTDAELHFALEVQQALFPQKFPGGGGLEFAGVCVPARGISGDYYDVLELEDGRLVFAIADISGKGISAAILMSNLQAVMRTLAVQGRSPRDVCSQLNRHLCDVTDNTRFATFFYAEWNRAECRLRYVNAGHNAPLLRGAGRAERLVQGGPPLGIFPVQDFEVGEAELHPHDLVVLYSDGITEAGIAKGEPFGESRLEAVISSNGGKTLAEIQAQVLSAIREWAGQEPEDDVTLLLIRASAGAMEART